MARFPWRRSLLVLQLLSACGGGSGTGPVDPPTDSRLVYIGNDFFRSGINNSTDPAVDTLSVDGTVQWIWTEAGDHSVIFDNQDLPMSEVMSAAGDQHTVTFPAAGSFDYICSVHGLQMTGTVVVR